MAAFSVQDAQSQRFLPVENSPASLCSISMGGKSGGYTYIIRELPPSKPVGFDGGSLWYDGKVSDSSVKLPGVPAPPRGSWRVATEGL